MNAKTNCSSLAREIMRKSRYVLCNFSGKRMQPETFCLTQTCYNVHELFFNPLTTIDDYSCHRNSATCYQLAQSVLKIGSALAERVGQGEVGGATAVADRAWRLL